MQVRTADSYFTYENSCYVRRSASSTVYVCWVISGNLSGIYRRGARKRRTRYLSGHALYKVEVGLTKRLLFENIPV